MTRVQWIEEPRPPAALGKPRVVGLGMGPDGRLTTIEKIGVAGVTISAISLAINLWILYRRANST